MEIWCLYYLHRRDAKGIDHPKPEYSIIDQMFRFFVEHKLRKEEWTVHSFSFVLGERYLYEHSVTEGNIFFIDKKA